MEPSSVRLAYRDKVSSATVREVLAQCLQEAAPSLAVYDGERCGKLSREVSDAVSSGRTSDSLTGAV